MSENPTRLYEGLFLVSQATAGSDFAGVVAHIKEVLARAEAQVHILTKWDERRLAYDIKTSKRGTYFLALFNARSTQVANIERDCNLSEIIMRALILRGDHIGEAELEEFKKATPAELDAVVRPADDSADDEVEAASEVADDEQIDDVDIDAEDEE
jgi:small subunit ribosomal protein S6